MNFVKQYGSFRELYQLNHKNLFQLKNKGLTPKKKVPVRKNPSNSDYIDDDEALRQVSFSGSWMISFFHCQASVERHCFYTEL